MELKASWCLLSSTGASPSRAGLSNSQGFEPTLMLARCWALAEESSSWRSSRRTGAAGAPGLPRTLARGPRCIDGRGMMPSWNLRSSSSTLSMRNRSSGVTMSNALGLDGLSVCCTLFKSCACFLLTATHSGIEDTPSPPLKCHLEMVIPMSR